MKALRGRGIWLGSLARRREADFCFGGGDERGEPGEDAREEGGEPAVVEGVPVGEGQFVGAGEGAEEEGDASRLCHSGALAEVAEISCRGDGRESQSAFMSPHCTTGGATGDSVRKELI